MLSGAHFKEGHVEWITQARGNQRHPFKVFPLLVVRQVRYSLVGLSPQVARHKDAVTVVTGIVGCAGLQPTVAAIEAGKDIALANKETLIAGAPYVLPLARKYGVNILPADSEHSALFQVRI